MLWILKRWGPYCVRSLGISILFLNFIKFANVRYSVVSAQLWTGNIAPSRCRVHSEIGEAPNCWRSLLINIHGWILIQLFWLISFRPNMTHSWIRWEFPPLYFNQLLLKRCLREWWLILPLVIVISILKVYVLLGIYCGRAQGLQILQRTLRLIIQLSMINLVLKLLFSWEVNLILLDHSVWMMV